MSGFDHDGFDERDDFPEVREPRRIRGRWLLVGLGLLAAVAIAVTIGITATSTPGGEVVAAVDEDAEEEEEPPPPPLSLETPTPAPLGDDAAARDALETTMETLVEASNEVLQRADGGTSGLEGVAVGFVAGEIQALSDEREHLGYKQIGEASVTSVNVRSMDLSAAPPTATLEVCIDTSELDVVDSNGASVADQLYQPDHPVLHLYGAVFTDGLWRVSTHEIPDGATCA